MQIVDAHHHIWRRSDLPWLLGPMQRRIFGPYEPIRRDYPVSEFKADIEGTSVEASVYVQVNWAPNWFVDEVAWVSRQAEESGWPHAIVGYCDLTQEDARPALDRLKPFPVMRGIRQQYHWHENPLYRFAPRADLVRDPNVVRNVGRLVDYGWSFDLQVFPGQMRDAEMLIEACPNVTFVLQHAGMLEDTSDEGWAHWDEGMTRLAGHGNVVAKLSGFGTFIHRNDPAHVATMVARTVGIFGADRCLYGSNYPIEKIWTSYADLLQAFLDATAGMDEADRTAIFRETARRVYRLDLPGDMAKAEPATKTKPKTTSKGRRRDGS